MVLHYQTNPRQRRSKPPTLPLVPKISWILFSSYMGVSDIKRREGVRWWPGKPVFNLRSKTQKYYLMIPCLTLSIIRYGFTVNRRIKRKEKRSPLHHSVVANDKGACRSLSTTIAKFTYIFIEPRINLHMNYSTNMQPVVEKVIVPYIYVYIYSPMARETGVQSQVEIYQRLRKWYLMPHWLTLTVIR